MQTSTISYSAEKPHHGANNVQLEEVREEVKHTQTARELINQYDWDTDLAYAVMMAESRGRARVVNPEWHKGCQGSSGLFQIACVHDDVEKLKDPAYNVQRAYEIYSKQGWRPWGAYTDGSYKQFYAKELAQK